MKTLILFDIDGTLIHTGGAGTRSMNMAFAELFGIKDAFSGYSMAGKTDKQIMRDGLKLHGLPRLDGNLESLVDSYLKNLKVEIHNPQRRFQPGIRDILSRFVSEGFVLGLLTGNLEQGARIKLDAFDLNGYFPDGAFGSDDEDRDRLLPVAIKKFALRGYSFIPRNCFVVGDTPRDVRCAKVHGAHALAVATGPYSREDLLGTEADEIFDTLEDVEHCVEFIMKRTDIS